MRWLAAVLMAPALLCQAALTLAEARQLALKNHPGLQAAELGAEALGERVAQTEAARRPVASGSVTGAGAPDASRVAAGALNNPVIYSRLAMGVTVSQLVADFGRTSELVASAKLSTEAEKARAKTTRADVLMNVHRAYFGALRSRAVVRIAESTVEARQLLVDQISALVNAQLKSELDLRFAQTNLAEAKLLVLAAANEYQAAQAHLSEAIGLGEARTFILADEAMPEEEKPAREALTAQALRDRPEAIASRLDTDASRRFALAENALKYPAISAVATVGVIPVHVSNLSSRYLAAGVNVTLPFLNGGLFKSRQREAELRSQQAAQRARQVDNTVAREVAVAMLDATTARERIGLTEQLIEQANQGLELAQSRYDLGLSSMVELSQAQLAKTNAEIQNATAQYEYQLRRAILDFRAGRL